MKRWAVSLKWLPKDDWKLKALKYACCVCTSRVYVFLKKVLLNTIFRPKPNQLHKNPNPKKFCFIGS